MFASQARAELEAVMGRKLEGMEEVMKAASPLWSTLTVEQKAEWKSRAKDYRLTSEYRERRRTFRHKAGSTRLPLPGHPSQPLPDPDPDPDSDLDLDADYSDNFDPGVPMVRGIVPEPSPPEPTTPAAAPTMPTWLEEKLAADKAAVRSFILANCPENATTATRVEVAKRCRWLFASVQSYGEVKVDGRARQIPAEVGLVEWSLGGGILEEYFRILGPWEGLEAPAAAAATARAALTHQLPLSGSPESAEFETSTRQVLLNFLGRSEPGVAGAEGVGVGLYKSGTEAVRGWKTGRGALLGGPEWAGEDAVGRARRWLVVLAGEVESVLGGFAHLAHCAALNYPGVPNSKDRIILAEALVEVLAELAADPAAVDATVATAPRVVPHIQGPAWDRMEAMYCSFHAPNRNTHCAIATARKAIFHFFANLKDSYGLPFYF